MKIALCLHGYFSNAGGVSASIKGHDYISRKLLQNHDVDVFVHSWDLNNKDTIERLYETKLSLFENQNSFESEIKLFDEKYFFGKSGKAPGMYGTNNIFKALSFHYSRKEAVKLKTKFEKDNDFKYDCVVLSRFDLGQRGKEHPQKYYATNFNFNSSLDMNFVYSAFWDQLNHGYADHWFFSNSDNINIVSSLYDKIFQYYQSNSDYVDAVTNGWPDSNSFDEFSNEFFQEKTSEHLKTFPLWACIDNHKLYKWYFIDTGLYEKSKFIDITEDR